MIVLGIDPGLANLGIGVVREVGRDNHYIHAELVRTSSGQPLPERLLVLHQAVVAAITNHQPSVISIESQFFHEQAGTAFKVGEAVGVVLLAAALYQLPVFEYGPLEVKQSLVGTGKASKEQVIFMVKAALGITISSKSGVRPTSSHEFDALALAMTHLAARRVREAAGSLRRV
jgi:crossover junction endodeoxyribonuclease RuvC